MIAAEFDVDLIDEDYDFGPSLVSSFRSDVRILARQYISSFFSKKEMHCGGKILDRHLFNDRNISLVLNTSIESAIELAYLAIESTEDCRLNPENFEDQKLCCAVLDECFRLSIPKEYAGGILLLYLNFCEGIYL